MDKIPSVCPILWFQICWHTYSCYTARANMLVSKAKTRSMPNDLISQSFWKFSYLKCDSNCIRFVTAVADVPIASAQHTRNMWRSYPVEVLSIGCHYHVAPIRASWSARKWWSLGELSIYFKMSWNPNQNGIFQIKKQNHLDSKSFWNGSIAL